MMSRKTSLASLAASALLLTLAAAPAHAVYKIVGPDGKITYSDTPPPPGSNASVRAVAVGGGGGAPDLSGLPTDLRQAATKYPVTLYAGNNCRPCEAGRQLLRQRGVPFAEKQVGTTQADIEMLQSLAGGSTLPVLTIGQQQLKGLVTADWNSYLDAAGYPRESKLPATYRAPAATPMVTRPEAPAPAEPQAPAPDEQQRPASGPNIRF
jgi:glutaredoxin